MRTSDMRVPQVEQFGRAITTLGGLAMIVAIMPLTTQTNNNIAAWTSN
jgi:hypothetical protein